MNAQPALYTIRVEGHLGATVLSAFPTLTAEQQLTQTVLVGMLDRSALYGVLAQMEMLGLELVEVTRTDRAPPAKGPDDGLSGLFLSVTLHHPSRARSMGEPGITGFRRCPLTIPSGSLGSS